MKKSEVPQGILDINEMICGCGNPECAWEQIRYILFRAEAVSAGNSVNVLKLEDSEWLAAYLCNHFRMTEHGENVRYAWITKEGLDAFAFLNTHGTEWFENLED